MVPRLNKWNWTISALDNDLNQHARAVERKLIVIALLMFVSGLATGFALAAGWMP